MNYQQNGGFTLVGMLVTLCVIAAMFTLLMPTLKSTTSKKPEEFNTAIKQVSFNSLIEKASQDVNSGLSAILTDYSANDLKETGLFSQVANNFMLGEALTKHMSIIKNCKLTANSGCFSQKYDSTEGIYRFITNAGAAIMINNNRNDCAQNMPYASICGYVYIDANGPQLPNTLGKDIVYFYITNNSGYFLTPQGGLSTH